MPKKQPKKRLWAKVDVEDVEDAMEDDRRIAKIRKPPKEGEEDADGLFTVDTKGSFEGISKASRRDLARAKLFPTKGPNIGLNATEEGKMRKAERQVEVGKRPVKPDAPEVFDLWGAPPASSKQARNAGFTRVITVPHQRASQDHRIGVKMPGSMHQKVGLAPAVIPAHEGQSVNPHRGAYEDLACMAAAAHLEREREDEETNRKILPMTAELRDAVGHERLKEMDEEEKLSLYRSLHAHNLNGGDDGEEGGDPNSKRKKEWNQKSQAYRNKKKKRRNMDSKAEQAVAQKRLDRSVSEMGTMKREMKDTDEWQMNRKKYRHSLREKRKELEATAGVVPKERKLGGGKYVEEAAVVPDAESGAKGLRSMPIRSSAIRERLQSVVRRGMLPPPSEATKEKSHWHKKKNNKLKRGRKFISPLLKDNLLLR